MNIAQAVKAAFVDQFKSKPTVSVFAPGRVNIIGEHTDYNLGHVLPFATTKGIYLCFRKSQNKVSTIYSIDYQESFELAEQSSESPLWVRYIEQVLNNIERSVSHFQLAFGGDLPIGAGMSSSSALTCGFVTGINALFDLGMSKEELLSLAIIAERGHGVQGGIMDQFTIINAQKDHAILLDCKTSFSTFVKIPKTFHFYLFNTNIKHNLLYTDYNNRTAECARIITKIKIYFSHLNGLCDLTTTELNTFLHSQPETLTPTEIDRATFIITENERTLAAVEAIKSNNPSGLGQLMTQSHTGLKDQYEVSCTELDWLVDAVADHPSILGARMMGGGFGGCTINLTTAQIPQPRIKDLQEKYFAKFGIQLSIYEVESRDGVVAEDV